MLASWKKSYDKPRQHIKKQRHHFAYKGLYGQSYGFPRSHVQMWELDYKENWVLKNWCFWIVVLKKTLEGLLDNKEINPEYPGRLDTKATILWPPDMKSWLIGKDPDADWRQEEKGMTECEMVGWHHWFKGHEFEQTLEDSEEQGSLACCSPWGHKESDMTEQLNHHHSKMPESLDTCFSFA